MGIPPKKKLFIIGASNFAREMESWLDMIPKDERDWELKGFLHEFQENAPLPDFPTDYEVLGSWRDFEYDKDDLCLLGISDPYCKEKIYEELNGRVKFYTFVAPNVSMGKFNEIGEGAIICPNCIITTNVKIGICATINCGSQIGHDSKVGSFSSIMAQVEIGGNCEVGGKALIGSNAVVHPNLKIGDNSKVGIGSVVIRNVKENSSVFGNPALKI